MLEITEWTEQEMWVWSKIKAGDSADLNKRDGGSPLNINAKEEWVGRKREIRPKFLEAILLSRPFISEPTYKGVRIKGAWFKEPMALENTRTNHELWLEKSRFDKDVKLTELKIDQDLSLVGSLFEGTVDLESANISGFLDLSGAAFTKKLDMWGLHVEGNILILDEAKFAEVQLGCSTIGGQIAIESTFTGELDMSGLHVNSHLLISNNSEFNDLKLVAAHIGGQLEMTDSVFKGEVSMPRLYAGKTFICTNSKFEKDEFIDLTFAEVGKNLDISGSEFFGLNLSGSRINGEFSLAKEYNHAKWRNGGKLYLRNAEVGAIQDHPKGWSKEHDLNGFTYKRLGGGSEYDINDMAKRNSEWFNKWLEKQKIYSSQPYHQLARVLNQRGQKEKANEILYAGKERERENSSKWRKRWWWLGLQKMLVGYGYRIHRALYWTLVLIFLGALVLKISGQGSLHEMHYGFSYSLDMLLPIIKLREFHYQIDLQGWARYYFYIHQMAGYAIASFLIAGLSGLIDKGGK